jgi:LmbE family N-acetylglucosaminyl deacetylase
MSGRAPLPEALERPPRGRVLYLAPHPDDDVIGAGGTLALHRAQGDPVHVLIVFDGVAGDAAKRFDPAAYRARRRAEARAGGARLGLADYEFWDYPEGHEPTPAELETAARRLSGRLRELVPDLVYAPWIGEQHVDHHSLARAARRALELAGFRGEAWAYEVWTPLVAQRIVDVSALFEQKRAALEEHRSQIEQIPSMLHKALALSAQRAMYLPGAARHGEAFAPLRASGCWRESP